MVRVVRSCPPQALARPGNWPHERAGLARRLLKDPGMGPWEVVKLVLPALLVGTAVGPAVTAAVRARRERCCPKSGAPPTNG